MHLQRMRIFVAYIYIYMKSFQKTVKSVCCFTDKLSTLLYEQFLPQFIDMLLPEGQDVPIEIQLNSSAVECSS